MKIKKLLSAACVAVSISLAATSIASAASLGTEFMPSTEATTAAPQTDAAFTESNTDTAADPDSSEPDSTPDTESEPTTDTETSETPTETETASDEKAPSGNPTESESQTTSDTETEVDGWYQDTNQQYYYLKDGERITNDWLTLSETEQYYFDEDGYSVTGFQIIPKDNVDEQYYFTDVDGKGLLKIGTNAPETIEQKVYFVTDKGLIPTSTTSTSTSTWPKDKNGKLYYPSTSGTGELSKGFQIIGSNYFYFSSDYSLFKGANTYKKIGNYYYFVKSNGVITRNGWATDPKSKRIYYANADGKLATKCVKKIGSKLYAFEIARYNKAGVKTISGKKYLVIDTSGQVNINRVYKYGSKYYYSDSKGVIKTGLISYNKKLYYANKNGEIRTGRFKESGKYYYANSSGQLYTSWAKYNNRYYYYDKKNATMKTGWLTLGSYKYFLTSSGYRATSWYQDAKKNFYYFDSKGVMQKGWEKVKSKWYYLDTKTGIMKTGWQKISGNYYYLNSNGEMQTGWTKVGSKWYYMNSTGARQYGWKEIKGSWYFMDKNTGIMKTGWIKDSGKYYYSNSSGAMQTGWMKRGSSWYYLKSSGERTTSAWLTDNAKKYYFNSSGIMLTGTQVVDGKTYNFGASGGIDIVLNGVRTIRVNRAANNITVYAGGVPFKTIICSTGLNNSTPLGTFRIQDKLRWHELNGPSWGQYCSHITADILFHSVPVDRYNDPRALNPLKYNQLGQSASAGCIRLTVGDALWLYNNCPVGTQVVIYDDARNPGPLGKAPAVWIPGWQTWDPTDPLFM